VGRKAHKKHFFLLLAVTFVFSLLPNFLHAATKPTSPTPIIQIKTLVLPDREHARMQPELFHALTDSANKHYGKDKLRFKFVIFKPYLAKTVSSDADVIQQRRILNLLNKSIATVEELKLKKDEKTSLLQRVERYIQENPHSHLAKAKKEITSIMKKYNFLVIESTGATVVHPIFYRKDIKNAEVGYATTDDIKDTLYGMFFLDAALEQNKPILGFCHGAQLAYLHAGGGLGRHVPFTPQTPAETKGAYYLRKNPHGGPVETWQIGTMLNTRDFDDYSKYGMTKYPLPKQMVAPNDQTKKYVNKDFNHTLAMTTPIPKAIEVFSYHPLSKEENSQAHLYELTPQQLKSLKKQYPQVSEESIKIFKNTMKQREIVDTFRYKSMLGFQYHPQYTYGDLDTSALFSYVIRDLLKEQIALEKKKAAKL